jgi:D-tyrosyl-tRNA(Tyr) deacylase
MQPSPMALTLKEAIFRVFMGIILDAQTGMGGLHVIHKRTRMSDNRSQDA